MSLSPLINKCACSKVFNYDRFILQYKCFGWFSSITTFNDLTNCKLDIFIKTSAGFYKFFVGGWGGKVGRWSACKGHGGFLLFIFLKKIETTCAHLFKCTVTHFNGREGWRRRNRNRVSWERGGKGKITERKKNYENVDGNSLNQSLFLWFRGVARFLNNNTNNFKPCKEWLTIVCQLATNWLPVQFPTFTTQWNAKDLITYSQ